MAQNGRMKPYTVKSKRVTKITKGAKKKTDALPADKYKIKKIKETPFNLNFKLT